MNQLDLDPNELQAALLFYLIGECRRIVRSDAGATLETLALNILSHHPATSAQIARALGHPRQTIQKIVSKLCLEQLCQKRPNCRNSRAPLIKITDQGREELARRRTTFLRTARRWHRLPENQELVRASDVLRILFH